MRSRLAVLTLTVVVGVAAAGTVGIAYAVHPFHHVVDASWAEAYPTVEEMTQHADAVVSGHVVAEQGTETSTQDPSLIYTNFAFQVDTWTAGKPSDSVVLLHQMTERAASPLQRRRTTRSSRSGSMTCCS